MEEKTYPIAEEFNSIQGEGLHAGAWMHFIRLAGCSVGKSEMSGPFVRTYCSTPCGQHFRCDTDFRMKEMVSVPHLVEHCKDVEHVCITGGEPFLHDLMPLVMALTDAGCIIHIETSGTRPIAEDMANLVWVTISPKVGILVENIRYAAEVKFLVSESTEQSEIEYFEKLTDPDTSRFDGTVFVQPINYGENVNMGAVQAAVEILKTHPNWRLSVQLHKLLSMH